MSMSKYILLDRDGTINVERLDYVKSFEEFIFLEGAFEALKLFSDNGYKIIIITNQSVVGRNIITEEELINIHDKMKYELLKKDITIFDIFYCTSLPDSNSPDRKPEPGMLLRCSNDYNINLKETYYIGDKETDVIAGKKAGCKTIKLRNNNLLEAAQEVILSDSNKFG